MFLHLDWSTPVVNSIVWTWFGKAQICLYKVSQLTLHIRAETKLWGWRNCLQSSLSDRIVSRLQKSSVASLILKWIGTTRTLPRAGRPAKLSNRGRRALEREVTKNMMVTLAVFFSDRDLGTGQGRGKAERSKVQIFLKNTWSRALRTSDWAEGPPSKRTMTLSTQPPLLEWMSLSGTARALTWTQLNDLWRPENGCPLTVPI